MLRSLVLSNTVAFTLAIVIGFAVDADIRETQSLEGTQLSVNLSFAEAEAARRHRVARRTARRTSRRMHYYNTLPRGCVLQGPYYYCSGIYYQTTVYNGANVYVIVTP